MKKLFALTICAALCGCTAMKSSRTTTAETVAAAHDMTLEKASTLPNIIVSGSSNVVTVAPSPQSVKLSDVSTEKGAASGDTRSTFHFGISVWLAIGFALLAAAALSIAAVFWFKSSASGATADRVLSETITAIEHGATDVKTLLLKKRAEL